MLWHTKPCRGPLPYRNNTSLKVHYKDILVGEYFTDLQINHMFVVQLWTVKALDDAHRMQCTNYLKATDPATLSAA